MATRKKSTPGVRSVQLSKQQAKDAIPQIERRKQELAELDVNSLTNDTGADVLAGHEHKINATLRSVYGADSIEYGEYFVENLRGSMPFYVSGMDISIRGNIDSIRGSINSAAARLATLIDVLKEQAGEDGSTITGNAIRAYEGLDLHPEIARAASSLYRSAHYSNAVEAAVKALNGLVRLRSGLEQDGSSLMERAFNPSTPVLKFNSLIDQSDKDEQKGFMMLFSGAVAGLRNPRAHGFIEDDPERALEFIAFVSLLAKLLDKAN